MNLPPTMFPVLSAICLMLLAGQVLSSEPAPSGAPAKVAWHFDVKEDDAGIPRVKLSLDVGGKRTLISEVVTGNYHEIERDGYKERGVPTEALTACRGTWAHSGKQFYVIKKDGKLQVFMREHDDESGYVGKYKLVKTVP